VGQLGVIAVVYVVANVVIYLAAGGDFGGMGAAAEAGDAWWGMPALYALMAVCLLLAIAVLVQLWRRRKPSVRNQGL
jgi:uncharacterized membrane protein